MGSQLRYNLLAFEFRSFREQLEVRMGTPISNIEVHAVVLLNDLMVHMGIDEPFIQEALGQDGWKFITALEEARRKLDKKH